MVVHDFGVELDQLEDAEVSAQWQKLLTAGYQWGPCRSIATCKDHFSAKELRSDFSTACVLSDPRPLNDDLHMQVVKRRPWRHSGEQTIER
jgi:hypothetical protein